MKSEGIKYWNQMANDSDSQTRDAILSGFRGEREFDESGRETVENLLLPFVEQSDVILDIGCGIGRLLKWVYPYCKKALAMDISAGMLKKAQLRLKEAKNVSFLRIPKSLNLPVRTGTIDFIYFYHVSEHLVREDAFKMLTEIRRCMRTTGKALVQFSLINSIDNQKEFRKWARYGDPEEVRSRFYTEEEVILFLEMASLFPQIRFYVPGEMVLVVTKDESTIQGDMPLVRFQR